ncbi:hypothetical protein [Nocardia sp. IFM 10818]
MTTTTDPDQPTHVEITATGDGYRAVIVAEIGLFSRSVQDTITTDPRRVQAHTVRAYFGLRCDTVESVRAIRPDAPEGQPQ